VVAAIVYPEIVLSEKFVTWANFAEGTTVTDEGLVTPPNGEPGAAVRMPVAELTVNAETSLAPVARLAAKTNSAELVGGVGGGQLWQELKKLPQPVKTSRKKNKNAVLTKPHSLSILHMTAPLVRHSRIGQLDGGRHTTRRFKLIRREDCSAFLRRASEKKRVFAPITFRSQLVVPGSHFRLAPEVDLYNPAGLRPPEWRFGGKVARSEYQERVAAATFSFASPNAARETVALDLPANEGA
jgi:hypothetical protein